MGNSFYRYHTHYSRSILIRKKHNELIWKKTKWQVYLYRDVDFSINLCKRGTEMAVPGYYRTWSQSAEQSIPTVGERLCILPPMKSRFHGDANFSTTISDIKLFQSFNFASFEIIMTRIKYWRMLGKRNPHAFRGITFQ